MEGAWSSNIQGEGKKRGSGPLGPQGGGLNKRKDNTVKKRGREKKDHKE